MHDKCRFCGATRDHESQIAQWKCGTTPPGDDGLFSYGETCLLRQLDDARVKVERLRAELAAARRLNEPIWDSRNSEEPT